MDKQNIAVLLLITAVVTAIAVPALSGLLEPYALTALFFVICFSLISFADQSGSDLFSFDKTTLVTVGWQQFILPSLILALAVLADLPNQLTTLLLVSSCAGALFASPTLAGILNLERHHALKSMLLSTLLMPVSMYLFLSVLNEAHTQLDLALYLKRAAIYLGVPIAILMGYRAIMRLLSTKMTDGIQNYSHWASFLSLLIFGVGIMHPVAKSFATEPYHVLFYLSLVSVMSILMFVLTAIVMHSLGMRAALTAAISSGFRNVGLSLALLGGMIDTDLELYVGLSMLPIFIAPAIMRLMMSKQSTIPLARA
jgi:BASS family bile acid:Na+ symporter